MVNPIPAGWQPLIPYLCIDGAAKAFAFYEQVFGATVQDRVEGPDGKIHHAEVKIGGCVLMFSDANADVGHHPPGHYGGSPAQLCLYVEDCDAVFKKAIDAGCTELRPLTDQFYGDRSGTVRDPFGYSWTISTHVKDMTPEEIAEAAKAAGMG